MSTSRQYIVKILRRTGLKDVAEEARRTLPDPVEDQELDKFAAEHGLSRESLMERMGGSP
jgi:hypothetical protein